MLLRKQQCFATAGKISVASLECVCTPQKSIMHKILSQTHVTNYNHAKSSLAFNNHNEKETVSSF